MKRRKPVYCVTDSGFEFRCSLKLAGGKSLFNVSKDLTKYKVKKMVGYLDYSLIRTPLTPLSEKELKYCENDIRVLLSYIQEKIEQDGDITRIPLTNTGYVRKYCRDRCFKRWRSYHNLMSKLTLEPEEFSQLKDAFQGGFTHANAIYVSDHMKSIVLENVGSHDFGSSYPATMVLEKFPMTKGKMVEKEISEDDFLSKYAYAYCCMFEIEIWDLEPIVGQDFPLSVSKCRDYDKFQTIVNNGRIVLSSHLQTTIVEQDYFVLTRFYKWSHCIIKNLWIYEKNYLPKPFVLSILDLYEKKTKLKGNPEEEVNYMISKNMINSSYGMAVTNPVRDEYKYVEENPDYMEPADLVEAIEKYNTNIRRFLFYPWGVWITAYARANLFSGIIELSRDYIYSDTDSLKSLNTNRHQEYFDVYNSQIMEKIEKAAKYHHIPVEMFMPETLKGVKKVIGVWEDEGIYEKFKTLGAKRYLTFRHETYTEKESDGTIVKWTEPKYVLTVAGANKEKAMAYLRTTGDPFTMFSHKLDVPEEYSGRLILSYFDNEVEGDVVDMYGVPYHYYEKSYIHMEPSEYTLSLGKDFLKFLMGEIDFGE